METTGTSKLHSFARRPLQVAISHSLKQMGLLVHTSFETPEGFAVSTVYCRIVSFTYSLASKDLTIQHECYLSREKRLEGRQRLYTPGMSLSYSSSSDSIPTMTSLYAFLKTTFEELGFTVDDVDPDPQPPAPTEPAPEPPAE